MERRELKNRDDSERLTRMERRIAALEARNRRLSWLLVAILLAWFAGCSPCSEVALEGRERAGVADSRGTRL